MGIWVPRRQAQLVSLSSSPIDHPIDKHARNNRPCSCRLHGQPKVLHSFNHLNLKKNLLATHSPDRDRSYARSQTEPA